MISLEEIQAFANEIVTRYQPDQIVLFGSYADGTANEGSDVDMLVVFPFDGSTLDMSLEILRATNPRFPIDLLARTPEKIAARKQAGDTFVNEIFAHGRMLYERRNA